MKNILLALVILFMFSCGDDTKNDSQEEKNSCDDITCEFYETCDEGVCNLNSGNCESDNDCKENNKTICNLDTHTCKEAASNCIGLSISGLTYYQNIYEAGGYSVVYEEEIETDVYFSVEFFETTPVGDYDLMSVGVNDNYETCKQCVLVYDYRAGDKNELYFLHTSGTLKVDSGDAYLENSRGSISSVKLQEVVMDWDNGSRSSLVDGGSCYEVQFANWSN